MPASPARRDGVTDIDAGRAAGGRRRARARPVALAVRTKAWLERGGQFVIGEGGARLLREVEARGSLLAAAGRIGWSYRHAWQYLRRAERALGVPLVTTRAGKGARRGTMLTAEGRRLLAMLRAVRARLDRAVGASGPTPEEIAARGGRRGRRRPGQPDARDR
jgi:molybdate transport system regulatory protein